MHPDEDGGRVTQVQYQLTAVDAALARLQDHISGLETRLCPILISPTPNAENRPGVADTAEERVPLADAINALTDRVDIEANRIHEMIKRCEL